MNLAQVDLNLLVALEAILSEKHLTRAGDRLGLSQPTMSHTLSRLRRLFGDELLTRVGREYYLTPLGSELVEPLRDILKNIELTIERRPAFDPGLDERAFVVSASDYSTYLALQPAIEIIEREAPHVSIQIVDLYTNVPNDLASGDIDLLIWPEALGPDMPRQTLFTDHWVAIAWEGHPEVGSSLTMEQYLAQPHIVYGTSLQDVSGIADRAIKTTHPEARITVTTHSFFLMPFLIGRSKLIALAHERLARRLAPLADIKIVKLLFDTPAISEAMFWHPRMTSDPAHRWLRNVLMESAKTMASAN
jgi:DNA-binding transcriptional LysR family regulator